MDSKLRCVFEMPVESSSFKQSPSNTKNDDTTGEYNNANQSTAQLQQASGELNQVKSDSGSPDQAVITAEIKQLRSESLKLRMEQVALKVSVQHTRRHYIQAFVYLALLRVSILGMNRLDFLFVQTQFVFKPGN